MRMRVWPQLATWMGGVLDREKLCFSLAVAVCGSGGGETVKAVEAALLFEEVGGEPQMETVRVVRCCSNMASSSSSSKLLKSDSVQIREYIGVNNEVHRHSNCLYAANPI